MIRASPGIQRFAKRIVRYEARAQGRDNALPASFRACAKIHLSLARLMGNIGFQALMTRALTLSILEFPALRLLQVDGDGSLTGLVDLKEQAGAKALARSGVTLLSQLLGLLGDLVGGQLTLRMMQEVWPDLSAEELHSDRGWT